MRNDHRRGETFHELRQAQEESRFRTKPKRSVPPAVARLIRIALVCLFGLLVLWLLKQADVPPLYHTIALGVVGIIVIVDVLRLVFD